MPSRKKTERIARQSTFRSSVRKLEIGETTSEKVTLITTMRRIIQLHAKLIPRALSTVAATKTDDRVD